MTPEAKNALSKTIRGLRARLLRDLHDATQAGYRLSIPAQQAQLDEETRGRRDQLESQIGRAHHGAEELRLRAEREAAYTLLNRLVILRLLEAPGPNGVPLREPAILSGGWDSLGYKQFRQLVPALVRDDETQGYRYLLQLAFEDLAIELPGVFGSSGVADLILIPAATLRHVVQQLNRPELASCWTDDMTLGWVYQFWNDPQRKRLDEKINPKTRWGTGKIEAHEISSKTQVFTDRYIVDWLLQNSVGSIWLAICEQQGWTPDVQSQGVLAKLQARREDWRAKWASRDVELTRALPIDSEAERRWAYYVPEGISDETIQQAPSSLRELKILDPAVGSGHFLVVALDLLVPLYREEARHRGACKDPEWSDQAIVQRIVSHNLHGIDLDPRAVQIAAAALWLKAQQLAPKLKLDRINVVASNLNVGRLGSDDPELAEFRAELARDHGLGAELIDVIVGALGDADHLGSLLRIHHIVEQGMEALDADETRSRSGVFETIERFLAKHTRGDDLGLRLRSEQLAAGVRFIRMLREEEYDLVVANPPYHSATKLAKEAASYQTLFPIGRADLFSAFILRSLQLLRPGGLSATVTLSNWMFLRAFFEFRAHLLDHHSLEKVADLGKGSFRSGSHLISASAQIVRRAKPTSQSVALRVYEQTSNAADGARVERNVAAILAQVGRYDFDPKALQIVPERPLIYWWDAAFLEDYAAAPSLGDQAPARAGLQTSKDVRFIRYPWELRRATLLVQRSEEEPRGEHPWVPLIKGAQGRAWIEPLSACVAWSNHGLELRAFPNSCPRNMGSYFRLGVAFSDTGSDFSARMHRFVSIAGDKGPSCFPGVQLNAQLLCLLNRTSTREIMQALNPGVDFQVGDVNRVPMMEVQGAEQIVARLEMAFSLHESRRETSVEFQRPGPSPWRYAQQWARLAVDREARAPLPQYVEELEPESPETHLSFALGVALGRFGAKGEGILDPEYDDLSGALPAGILFLDTTLDELTLRDSLGHPAARPLHRAWEDYSAKIETKRSLRDWLAFDFFKSVHKNMYQGRPIHWPLSSAKKTFVAWVNLHRLTGKTLRVLIADHLEPTRTRFEGELTDLRATRDELEKGLARDAQRRYEKIAEALEELSAFIADVEQCAEYGAPAVDHRCPDRERDASYVPSLDDGVMINAAALWKLLEPQWKAPKIWWKEIALAESKGNKDHDWSKLAMRYWPTRVDAKCKDETSLAIAHGCMWRYHPERAWAWELRLQEEIGSDFRLVEAPYQPGGRDLEESGHEFHRARWLAQHPKVLLEAVEKEVLRRMGPSKERVVVRELHLLDPGLWSALPEAVWAMELRLAKKQKAEFRLRSPDESDARTAFESAHPDLVQARREVLEKWGR